MRRGLARAEDAGLVHKGRFDAVAPPHILDSSSGKTGMFDKLRHGLVRVLVFGLFAILVLSFAIWGIGDVVRTGGGGPVAEVGGTPVQPAAFTQALQQRRQMLGRQLGQPLTPEQSRAYGIDNAVLSELISGAAISNHARALGLGLSDDAIAELIRSDPAFHGADNTFSKAVFDERMRQSGFTEQRYFAERKRDEVRDQLAEAMLRGVTAPGSIVDIVHRFREETRSIAAIKLVPSDRLKVGEPDEAALKAFYEEQKARFTEPERRSLAVLVLTPEDLKERTKITDEEVKASWEQARAAWDLPERRRVQQISYKTKAEAEGEAKAIEGGKSFLLAALEANARAAIDGGLVARREIGDQNFAKAAFELPLNKVSAPISVRGGYFLIRVTEIEPARQRSFDEVAKDVRQGLEETRLRELSGKLHDDIEDRRGASDAPDRLKKLADELKLKLIEAKAVDKLGLGADGKPGLELADAQRLIATGFEGDKSTPREVVQLTGGGEAWVDVTDIQPARTKPLDEIKADVVARWKERETQLALTKEAQALVARLKGGETLDAIAKELGLGVETTAGIKRASAAPGITPAAARIVYTLPQGGAGSSTSPDGGARQVFVVTEIKPAEPASEAQTAAIRQELEQALQQDVMQAYVVALREQQGVRINEVVLKRTLGLDQAQ